MQTFRMAEKQISVGSQKPSEAVNHFDFGFPFEIDQNVAAENQIKRAGNRIRLLSQIHALKSDDFPDFVSCFDLSFFRAKTLEHELSLILHRNVRHFLGW